MKYFEKLCETLGKGLISDYKPTNKQIYHFEHYDLIIEPRIKGFVKKGEKE